MKKTDDKTLIESMRRKAAELIATDSITSSVELILLADDFDRCADRLEELVRIVDGLNGTIESMQQTNDALIGKLNAEKL